MKAIIILMVNALQLRYQPSNHDLKNIAIAFCSYSNSNPKYSTILTLMLTI